MSLAERVDHLEQQQSNAQGSVDLVNRINDLQAQVQALQGQNEELKHQLDLLKDAPRAPHLRRTRLRRTPSCRMRNLAIPQIRRRLRAICRHRRPRTTMRR